MQAVSLLLLISCALTLALPSEKLDLAVAIRDTQAEPAATLHPLRDPSKLKYEVVGIVGAYLFWLIATILLIVYVGNRLRRKAQTSDTTLKMTIMRPFHPAELVNDTPLAFQSASVKSPQNVGSPLSSPRSIKSPRLPNIKTWGKKFHKKTNSTYSNTTLNSEQLHEEHKAKDMDDLTKLYAAVMAHDEEKSQGKANAASPTSPSDSASPASPGYPPEFAHLHNLNAGLRISQAPLIDRSLPHPMAPTPTAESFARETNSHYDPRIPSRESSRTIKTTPLSFVSDVSSRATTIVSPRHKPARISVRGQPISQPIGSADLRNFQYDETVPLSPRFYTPGPAPPTPNQIRQAQVTVDIIEEDEPSSYQYQHDPQLYSSYAQYQQEQFQQIHPQYSHQGQQMYRHPSPPSPRHEQEILQPGQPSRERRAPPALALRSTALSNATASASSSSRTLPFRNMYGDSSLRSAPPTKTTFLEHPSRIPAGPLTSIAPSTPYSPYTPNALMTPLTPRRMMNKQEIKAKRKEESKLKILSEDDLVVNDDDMWGK